MQKNSTLLQGIFNYTFHIGEGSVQTVYVTITNPIHDFTKTLTNINCMCTLNYPNDSTYTSDIITSITMV